MDKTKPRDGRLGVDDKKEPPPPSDGPVEIDLSLVDSAHVWDDLPKHLRIKKKVTYIRKHGDRKLASKLTKIFLLMWKNWLSIKRGWLRALFECATPIVTIALLTIYVSTWPEITKGHPEYQSFTIKQGIHAFKNCKKFVFIPEMDLVTEMMNSVQAEITNSDKFTFETMISTEELEGLDQNEICAAIIFNFKTADLLSPLEYFPSVIDFSIRMSALHNNDDLDDNGFLSRGGQWETQHTHSSESIAGPRNEKAETGGSPGYYTQGFLFLQHLVSEQIIRKIYVDGHAKYTNKADAETSYETLQENILVRLQRFPYPSYKDSSVIRMIHDNLPLTIVISYLIPVMLMVWGSVIERQSGIRIQMKAYGIPLSSHRGTWVLRCMLIHTPAVAIITTILSTNWTYKKEAIFTRTEPWIFFFMMMAYVWQTVCTSILVVSLFRRSSTATACAGVFWFATYIPYFYVKSNYNNFTFIQRLLASTLGNTAISMGCHLIAEGESMGIGVQWHNFFSSEDEWTTFTVGWVIIMLVINGIIEWNIAKYISRINPDHGISPLPWNYLVKPWFWRNELPPDEWKRTQQDKLLNSQSLEERYPENFEVDVSKQKKELEVEAVTKYIGGERILNKVKLSCHVGQLTAMIGEPGSGKSTLFSIISGLTAMTEGTIIVSREDRSKHVEVAKAFVGYCPSNNLLYPHLTVQETLHLYVKVGEPDQFWIFKDLKGLRDRIKAWDEVERFLIDGMLVDYRNNLVSELTASSKRMLMISCAFIGGSRVILLDEPTAQMSVAQKRMVWDFITKHKKYRTVLVAMDSMNEGDNFVDQVLVFQHGEVSCRGSIKFIQQKFGGGYHLIIDKGKNCNVKEIIELVTRRIKGSTVEVTEKQLNFLLPEENSSAFPGLFEELEKKEKMLRIDSHKGSFVTIDEVFHNIKRIAMETDYDPENRKAIYSGAKEVDVDDNFKRIPCLCHWVLQFELLILKNVRFGIRRKLIFLITTVIPLLCVATCGFVLSLEPFHQNPVPLKMDLEPYTNPQVLVDCYEATNEGKFLCLNLRRVLSSTFSKAIVKDLSHRRKDTISEEIVDIFNETIEDKTAVEVELPLLGVEINSNAYSESNVEFVGYFNNQPLHVPPVVLSIIDNALLDYMVGVLKALYPQYIKDRGNIDHTIQVTNYPLPFTPADRITFASIFISPGFFLGVATTLGYAVLIASFVILDVREREFRHLQMIAGANSFLFWAANYVWNFFHFTIVASLNCLIMWVLHVPGFDMEDFLPLFILLECYGLTMVFFIGAWCIIPFAHWGLAFSRTFLFLVLTGPLFMLSMIALSDPTANVNLQTLAAFHNIFLLSPSYSLGIGVFYIVANSIHDIECEKVDGFPETCPKSVILNPFNEFSKGSIEGVLSSCCHNGKNNDYDFTAYGIGRNLTFMLLVSLISLAIRTLKESAIWTKMKQCWIRWEQKTWTKVPYEHEIHDYDVLNETLRVFHGGEANDLIVKNLTKDTPSARRVDGLCVEVDKGECFCLLGIGGAGKTITLKMLVGNKIPTSGDATIHGISLMNDYKNYIHHLGYCPETYPFLGELTGHETLNLIGTLRRIPHHELDGFITNLSLRLLFLHDLDIPVKNYNPMSKKKLAAAVAMLGSPDVVIFDEPTTEIDLVSREFLFKSINNLVSKGSIVIMSSHSVAECEAVCTKMAIMVNGKLKCYGSPQHLKDLFSEGFTVIVKFALDPKKIYFTTMADRSRVHERKITPEHTIAQGPLHNKRFHDDDIESSSQTNTDRGHGAYQITTFLGEDEEEPVLTTWEEDLFPFMAFFERNFPDAIMVDKQPGLIHYHIRQGHATASTLFSRMEEAKVVAEVESYYVGQTNLDQVYINFTRGQRPHQL